MTSPISDFFTSDAATCCHYTPRVISAIAGGVVIITLLVLAGQHLSVIGTTSSVTASFQHTCLTIAKWAGVTAAASVGVGLIKDIFYAIGQHSEKKRLFVEMAITIITPAACCLLLQRQK